MARVRAKMPVERLGCVIGLKTPPLLPLPKLASSP